jgi:hypothetical protein
MPLTFRPGSTSVNAESLETSFTTCMYRMCGDVSRFPSVVTITTLPNPSSFDSR